jgi:hypothetical protein
VLNRNSAIITNTPQSSISFLRYALSEASSFFLTAGYTGKASIIAASKNGA